MKTLKIVLQLLKKVKIKLFSRFNYQLLVNQAFLNNSYVKEKYNWEKRIKQIISINIVIILSAVLFFAISGCKIEEKQAGSLSLQILTEESKSKLTKTILPEIDMNVSSYDIMLSGPYSEIITTGTDNSGMLTIDDLTAGEWAINVTAKNYDEQAVGGKVESIQILPHKIVKCEIIIIPYEGFGMLRLTVTWDDINESKLIQGRIESSMENIVPIEFTINEGNNLYEDDAIPAGYYTLNITLYNNGEIYGGAVDVVRIVAGEITEAVIHVLDSSPNGGAGIEIIPVMNDPIGINLSGCTSSVNEGEVFTATAEIDEELDALFSWYIDGAQKLSGLGESDYTISDDLEAGIHRLDVTVFSLDGLRGGSASYTFEVTAVPATVPMPPTGLALSVISHSQINLSWTDNSSNELGFRIERALDDNGNPGAFNEVVSVTENMDSYSDSGLTASTKYYYRVFAYNNTGNSLYSNVASSTTSEQPAVTQIIADHTVVDKYNDIPQQYIDEVKKMYLNVPGESHSAAYRTGLVLLMGQDSRYAVVVTESGSPTAYREDALRIDRFVRNQYNNWSAGAGEALWYTWHAWDLSDPDYPTSNADMIKNHITYCNTHNLEIAAIGFGWCWDMTWSNSPGGTEDPVYGVRWAGSSEGGPDGNMRWGLDDDDTDLTANSVNMDDYLQATEEYFNLAQLNGYDTKVFFTTGPVDGYTGENGYQRHLKHEYIREFVREDASRILFDYADILCYDDNSSQATTTWNSHTYPVITSTNLGDGSIGHIGSAGALRLAKAQWWMLARIAGWDGVSTD